MTEAAKAAEFVSRTITDYHVQNGELKGSNLLKYHKGHQAIEAVLKQFCPSAKVVVHEKQFALAGKFFEHIFEPVLAEQNGLFYGADFHKFIAGMVYAYMKARHESTEQLIRDFSHMMRTRDASGFEPLKPSNSRIVSEVGSTAFDQMALFAALHKSRIEEEIDFFRENDDGFPRWLLDLSATSLFGLLSDFSTQYDSLLVYCDDSKPLNAHRALFDSMVDRPDMLGIKTPFNDRQFGFNLVDTLRFVESKSCPGVQIADVLAAAASFCVNNKTDKTARAWWPLFKGALSDGHLVADLSYADLNAESGFVGAGLLDELVRRSLQKGDLFDGVPKKIKALKAAFALRQQSKLID